MVSDDLGMDRGCGQCPGTGFQKIGAYVLDARSGTNLSFSKSCIALLNPSIFPGGVLLVCAKQPWFFKKKKIRGVNAE